MNYSDDNEKHSMATHKAKQITQQMGEKKLLHQIWLQYFDSPNVFCLSRRCADKGAATAPVTHDSASVSRSKAVLVPNKPHSSSFGVWLFEHRWNFMTQFPCWFFRSAIKWSRSQGNHLVLAETSMIRLNVLHIKHIIHISTNTDNGGKSIVCNLCVCVCVCFGAQINKNQAKKDTVYCFLTLPVLFPAARKAHHFITPPAVSAQ